MMANTNAINVKALVLAKSLFMQGCNHASINDEVNRMYAIHCFDAAVEMILKQIAIKKGIQPKRKYFYFEELIKKIRDLPLKEQITGLHNLRNIIQHQGDIPTQETVVKYMGYVEDFLVNVINKEFGLSFRDLALSTLIRNEEIRKMLAKAETLYEEGRYKDCITQCDETLIKATFDVANVFETAGVLTSYFGIGDEFKKVIQKDYAEKFKGKEFYGAVKELSKALGQLAAASTAMQFLDQYRVPFLYFREIINKIEKIPDSEIKNLAKFCLNFVTNLILKWQGEGLLLD